MNGLLFFGIDGGGTRSRIAVVDQDLRVLGNAVGGSTNIYSVSKEEVFQNLTALIDTVCAQISIDKAAFTEGCLGSAGLGRPGERALFQDFFNRFLGDQVAVHLCTDGEILLCGGLQALEGFCLVAGTGSLALGRALQGPLVRAGGLGYMLGDEGSAWWIGHEAISRALRSVENRDLPTSLLLSLMQACGLEEPQDFIAYAHQKANKAEIAALAPLVTAAADQGDALALDILQQAAWELASLVESVVHRSPGVSNQELVLAGGVMEHDAIVRKRLLSILKERLPGLSAGPPKGTALEGACLLAVQAMR
jgi:N-acetylglucosamine kinase-like BadF-type ATPase